MTVVAIDGPAGAGKSTVARAVARRLGFAYLDTGALYRALTVALLEAGIDVADGPAGAAVARTASIELRDGHVWLDDRDVSDRIRAADVTAAVSTVAGHPEVRAALVPVQRDLARAGAVVIEGRDIAATIAPDAEVKVFLTAAPDERARRRSADLGLDESHHSDLVAALTARDLADSTRASSPLVRVPDAVVIDSTHKDLEAVVDEIVGLVEQARVRSPEPGDG